MFYQLDRLVSDTTVVALEAYDDAIVLFDKNYTLYRYNEECKMTYKQTILPNQEQLHTYTKSVSFSPVTKHMLAPFADKPMGLHLDIAVKPTLVNKLTQPRKTVETTAFSSEGSYFAVGDAAGRTNLFHAATGNLVTSFLPRPDYISCLQFSSNERFLVSSSYDKSTTILDTILNIEIAAFKTNDVVEGVAFFNDNHSIAMIQRNGAFQIYHIDERHMESDKNLFVSWPTAIVTMKDERHVLVGMKNGSLVAVNLETQEIAFDEKITNSGVTQLVRHENMLMVAQEKGYTLLIDIEHDLEEFENALKIKEHHRLKDMIGENIFLVLSKDYDEEMIELYEPLFKKVNALIEQGKVDEARELVEPYENDPKIMKSFEMMAQNEHHVKKLAELVKAKKVPEAYMLIEKYPILKETPASITLERQWQQAFNKAKVLCKKNDVVSFKDAQKILATYERVVEKQPLIHAVLKNIKVYIQADDLVSKKQFKAYFALVQKAPFLAENEVHKNIIEMSKKLLGKLKQAIHANDFAKAKELLAFLTPFTNLEQDYNKAKQSLFVRISFFDALRKNDINTIFSLAKDHTELRHFREYEEIENKFKTLSKQALDMAFKSDTQSIMQLFEPYRGITLFEDKIASLIKISYINEMRQAAKAGGVDWENAFTRFITYFGRGDELIHLAQQINQLEVLKSIKVNSDRQGFKKYELPVSILS